MRPLDIAGQRYGRLTALRREPTEGKHTKWIFACDCGSEVSIYLDAVRRGASTSCGCLRTEQIRARSLTHGHKVDRTASRTLKAYQHAKSRCTNPKDEKYPVYGARGIAMSPAWAASFHVFLEDMGECPPGLTLDRIDVNGDYEKGNCQWATYRQQFRNKTNNVWVEHEGERMILTDFAAVMGVSYKALHWQVTYRGKSPHEAVQHIRQR